MPSQRVDFTGGPAHTSGPAGRSAVDSMAILDGIDGAWDRAQVGRHQASIGETVPLDEL